MKNKVKFAIILAICVIAGTVATGYILYQDKNTDKPIQEPEEQKPVSDVVVNIKPQEEQEKVYEEIVDTETGETEIAEVQENVPPQKKSTTPPDNPKAEGSYTNPDSPPSYTKEQTVKEKEKSKTVTTEKKKTGGSKGQVYIEGFGYVDDGGGGSTAVKGTSDGDINKQIGVMD